jgi:hypothetical protein
MHEPAPFRITPEAGTQLAGLLRGPQGMESALILVLGFEESDGTGGASARFDGEHFMVGFYSSGQVAQWPRYDVFGRSVVISPDALERLRGRTLELKKFDIGLEPGTKEERELLVIG